MIPPCRARLNRLRQGFGAQEPRALFLRSEQHSQPETHLPLAEAAGDAAEVRVAERAVGVVEMRCVWQIENIDAEFALGAPEIQQLRDRRVEVVVGRAV